MIALFGRSPPSSSASRAHVPAGQRVYAVGDVHGRSDLLDALLEDIAADDAARGPADTTLIFLGDLIDRGPDSAAVIRRVQALIAASAMRVRVIRGNHEEIFARAVRGDVRAMRLLLEIGGEATLRSFGVTEAEASAGSFAQLASVLQLRVPSDVLRFIDHAEDLIVIGRFAFVHAGIRPGVPLAEQAPTDLRWIRDAFLTSRRDHGKIIVHGHTPTPAVEVRPNRIGLDTGAGHGGPLSAVGLQDDDRWFLSAAPPAGGEFVVPALPEPLLA